MIGTLARRSLRARLGRAIGIAFAILASVAFVAGSFILADSMKKTFDNLFAGLVEDVDYEVRTILTTDSIDAARDPVSAELLEPIAAVDGVEVAEGGLQRYAQLIDKEGEPVSTQGAPALGVSWSGPSSLTGVELKDGAPPDGADSVVVDKATAEKAGFGVGDEVTIVFDSGRKTFRIDGLVGLGDTDGFAGASLAMFDPVTAQDVLGGNGTYDMIDLKIADGADPAAVKAAIEQILPDRTEVVTGEQVADEQAEGLNQIVGFIGTGLLIFAFITAFVSAFLISNVFGITIGQRLRELALLRAVGASPRQVRRLIVLEALAMSVVATLIGIGAGFGVAKLITAAFNAAGGGFPPIDLLLKPRTVIVAALVGIGITLASALIPAYRAARIPPVAAMRPEVGFEALSGSRRLVGGSIVTGVGVVLFLLGLFLRPGGTLGLIALTGGGAFLIFIGVASLSTTIARPVSRTIGAPLEKTFGTAGRFARDNASRSPRRTARTAAALMIGVALISAAAVFASSLRDTFGRILERAITADYVVTDESFQGLPETVGQRIAALDEVEAMTPFRAFEAEVTGEGEQIFAIDPATFPQLADLSVVDGGYDGLIEGDGLMLVQKEADKRGVGVGDTLDVTWQNGVESTLTISGLFTEEGLPGTWYVSLDTLQSVTDLPARDFFVLAKLADGADPDTAKLAIDGAVEEFPQAVVETNSEFQQSQEDQINQILLLVTFLLLFAIVISFIGIAITLALSVFERTREIGLLRAVGMNRKQLRRSVRIEAVIVSVFGVVVGVVVGLLLGVALSYAVPNTVIDGITFPTGTIVMVLIAAVIAALVAAAYPAHKASKMNVLDAISTE